MNLNIIAYVIYFLITVCTIVHVGKVCYRNGNVYVQHLLKDNLPLCRQINKTLLIGYYLMNIGYCAITLVSWQIIKSHENLVEVLAARIAFLVLSIGIMHYLNIIILTKYIHKLKI